MATGFIRVSKWEGKGEWKWGSEGKTEITAFCNLILEVTSYHFCHIFWVSDQSLDYHTWGEGLTQQVEVTAVLGAFQMLPDMHDLWLLWPVSTEKKGKITMFIFQVLWIVLISRHREKVNYYSARLTLLNIVEIPVEGELLWWSLTFCLNPILGISS